MVATRPCHKGLLYPLATNCTRAASYNGEIGEGDFLRKRAGLESWCLAGQHCITRAEGLHEEAHKHVKLGTLTIGTRCRRQAQLERAMADPRPWIGRKKLATVAGGLSPDSS